MTLSRVHDLGGHDVARELWAEYFTAVNAIVYLVDCNDRDRFPEAKAELDKLLSNDQLQGVPFLILGNKIDMQRAASEPELRQALGLQHYLTGKVRILSANLCGTPLKMYCSSAPEHPISWSLGSFSSFLRAALVS
jgi:GTP-binding protein SAR1